MKAKTINIVLCRKLDAWLASIEDEAVREMAKHNTIITGGCIASMLLGEEVNDFDLYFRNKATAAAVAGYYVDKFKANPPPRFATGNTVDIYVDTDGDRVKIVVKSAGIASEEAQSDYQYFEALPEGAAEPEDYVEGAMAVLAAEAEEGKPPFRPIFLSSNAITLSDRLQLIVRFYGEPDDIHENYDFAHCTNFWDSKTRSLTFRSAALETLLTKELRYVGSKYPLCSVIRTRKFIQRGFTINAGQYLKMLMQLNALDLTKIDVLEDQLVGVDAAHFLEVVAKLREKDPEKVNSAYLVEIIDRIF